MSARQKFTQPPLAGYGPWRVVDTLTVGWKARVHIASRRKLDRFLVVSPTNVSCIGGKDVILASFQYLPHAEAFAAAPDLLAAADAFCAFMHSGSLTHENMRAVYDQARDAIGKAKALGKAKAKP